MNIGCSLSELFINEIDTFGLPTIGEALEHLNYLAEECTHLGGQNDCITREIEKYKKRINIITPPRSKQDRILFYEQREDLLNKIDGYITTINRRNKLEF